MGCSLPVTTDALAAMSVELAREPCISGCVMHNDQLDNQTDRWMAGHPIPRHRCPPYTNLQQMLPKPHNPNITDVLLGNVQPDGNTSSPLELEDDIPDIIHENVVCLMQKVCVLES